MSTVFGRAPVLDTVERVSEMCFGLFMALTFVGAVFAADGSQDGRTMFYTALGCNFAWGLVDAVMYLVRTITLRGKLFAVARTVRAAPDATAGVKALRDGMPTPWDSLASDTELEAMRARLMAAELPTRPQFYARDFAGAVGIFIIVAATTFPVALPFVVMNDVRDALVVSRTLSLTMLFFGGLALGRFAGYGTWRSGVAMVALGMVLTAAIIALGG
jgi:hypothetical protein